MPDGKAGRRSLPGIDGIPAGARTKGSAKGAIEKTFTPEFLNRLDARVAFKALDVDVIKLIVDKFIKELNAQMAEQRVIVKLTPKAREWLAKNGFDAKYGARPMQRLIHQKIKQPLAKEILFGKLTDGGNAKVVVKSDELKIDLS